MIREAFELETGGEKRLELVWRGYWKDFTVILDGKSLGMIPNVKTLSHGCDVQLPDGSVLGIRVDRKLLGSSLILLRDGQPVPGSATSPQRVIKNASDAVYFISGMSLLLGLISELFHIQLLQQNGIGYGSMIVGFIYMPLAYYTHEGSRLALGLAIFLFLLDGVGGFVLSIMGGTIPIEGIFIRFALLILMVRGMGAITSLKQSRQFWGMSFLLMEI